jgi:tetratricopeptide (TPR) repeat protein
MLATMRGAEQGLVCIVRDFIDAHRSMHGLLGPDAGDVEFERLRALIGDDDDSVLFRLKERCHELFRNGNRSAGAAAQRESLFDLAVGSLFHEAMKFRENAYQRDVYGPRVAELRSSADEQARELFDEFEKILASVSRRLHEGRDEVIALLAQTAKQLRLLLAHHSENGLLARHLTERPEVIETVFDVDFDALLAEIYGDPATGHRRAGRSHLDGGNYRAAIESFARARDLGERDPELTQLSAFARGMHAYLQRDWPGCVHEIAQWASGTSEPEPDLARLAHAVVSRVVPLARREHAIGVSDRASELASSLQAAGGAV